MKTWFTHAPFQRGPGGTLLGLALDAGRLEGALVRRTNGAGEVKRTFGASLSLDVLTEAPELVGREIRKHLDAADIRERRCVVGIPLSWALTLQVALPDLPPADLEGFLQVEAERGFPYTPDALLMAESRFRTPAGTEYATLVAVPRDHVTRLEAVLQAAQLRPVSFSLGITALQSAEAEASQGVLALAPSDHSVGLQVSCGGGVAVLRTLEGTFELEGGTPQLQADQVARETRVTLGQLPADLREGVRRVRVFGGGDAADALAEQLGPRFEPMGITVEQVRDFPAAEYGLRLPAATPVSAALALAVRTLTEPRARFEFLPPRVSGWQRLTSRYSSRKLVWVGGAAGAAVALVALAFLFQQWQLWRWGREWQTLKPRALALEQIQQQIKLYRPWFDDSRRSLSVLRRLTEAFPEDGTVSAKTVEIREAASITCSGTAQDRQALIRTLDRLRATQEVSDVRVDAMTGRSPLEFRFNFRWVEGSGIMNLGQITSRQQRLAILAILGVALLAGDRLLVTPLTKSWKTRAERIAQLKQSVSQGKSLFEREESIRARWDTMRTNTLDSQSSVAESQVLRAFDRWSRDSGVSISSLRPQWKRTAGEHVTLECRADASGDLSALTRFLYQAETDPLALKIDVVEITARDTGGQQLTLALQVSGLLLKPSGS